MTKLSTSPFEPWLRKVNIPKYAHMSDAQAALVFPWISSENLPNLANFVKGIRDYLFSIWESLKRHLPVQFWVDLKIP